MMSHTEDWIQGPVLSCYGVRVGFRTNHPGALAAIDSISIPGARACDPGESGLAYSLKSDEAAHVHAAYIGSRRLIQASNLDCVIDFVRSHVRHVIAENSSERLFVHAGVVGWRGSAILLPGRSRAGKSLLVRELIRAGATYFSDEFAVLDANGFVYSFAHPISVRTPNGKIEWLPSQRRPEQAAEPLPVGLVLFTKYMAGAVFRPERLTDGQAVLELLQHFVAVRKNPRAALRIARSVIAGTQAFSSPRGEAHCVAKALLV